MKQETLAFDVREIKKNIRDYYKHLYVNKQDNL